MHLALTLLEMDTLLMTLLVSVRFVEVLVGCYSMDTLYIILVEAKNSFVEVTFKESIDAVTMSCKFLQWQPSRDGRYRSNCSISYGYSSRFPAGSQSTMGLSSNNLVILKLSIGSIPSQQEYRFIVTASNGTFMVQVTGIFSKCMCYYYFHGS